MATETWPDTPTVLQGAYACDLATDVDGGAFGAWAGSDWAEEALFGVRTAHPGGHWQFAPGHDERDFMARLGKGRFRVYAGNLVARDLRPVELTESRTAIQDPAAAVFGDQRLVAWGERLDDGFVARAWTGAEAETVAHAPASLTRPSAAIDSDGQPWVTWQAFDGDTCVVVVSRRRKDGWTRPAVASVKGQSAWQPVLRASAGHGVWLAWDAWTGHQFHVFVRRIAPDGTLGPAIQVSDLPLLSMDADIAVDADDTAWITWEQSPPWGADHRFNATRQLALAAVDAGGATFIARSPWGAGQAPIPIESFTQSLTAEYIVPVSPRLVVGRDGIELFFRRFPQPASEGLRLAARSHRLRRLVLVRSRDRQSLPGHAGPPAMAWRRCRMSGGSWRTTPPATFRCRRSSERRLVCRNCGPVARPWRGSASKS